MHPPTTIIASYPDDFFFFNRFILRYAGLWSPETTRPLFRFLYASYAVLVLVFVNVWFTATEFVSIFSTYRDLHDLIKNVNFALTHLMGAVKCVFWHRRSRRLLKMLETLESSEFNYETCGEKNVKK